MGMIYKIRMFSVINQMHHVLVLGFPTRIGDRPAMLAGIQ